MRPDDHRRKKNEAYKKKHNLSTQKAKKESTQTKLDSNADRYDDEGLSSHEPAGKDMRELLDIAANQAGAPSGDELEGEMSGLDIDTNSVAHVADCFSLMELLRLEDDELMRSELDTLLGDADNRFSNYLDTCMDPVYVVDHKMTKALSKAEIIYKNTGQRIDVSSTKDSAEVPAEKFVDPTISPEKDEELEDWLDSILDD